MKKWIVLLCAAALFSTAPAMAKKKRKALVDEVSGQGYGAGGCGLGSIVFGEKEGIVQLVSWYLNYAVSGNIWYGMTSGTSNCVGLGGSAEATNVYISANKDALKEDISKGEGATLSGLAQVLGCTDEAALGQSLQKNYESIFTGMSDAKQIQQSIVNTVEGDERLKSSCEVG